MLLLASDDLDQKALNLSERFTKPCGPSWRYQARHKVY